MSGPDDAVRAERLAAALRENLKRRKQQARGRTSVPRGDGGESSGEAADGEAVPPPGRAQSARRDGEA